MIHDQDGWLSIALNQASFIDGLEIVLTAEKVCLIMLALHDSWLKSKTWELDPS